MLLRFLSRRHYSVCEFNAAEVVYLHDKRLHFKVSVRVIRVRFFVSLSLLLRLCFDLGLWVYFISFALVVHQYFTERKTGGKRSDDGRLKKMCKWEKSNISRDRGETDFTGENEKLNEKGEKAQWKTNELVSVKGSSESWGDCCPPDQTLDSFLHNWHEILSVLPHIQLEFVPLFALFLTYSFLFLTINLLPLIFFFLLVSYFLKLV